MSTGEAFSIDWYIIPGVLVSPLHDIFGTAFNVSRLIAYLGEYNFGYLGVYTMSYLGEKAIGFVGEGVAGFVGEGVYVFSDRGAKAIF